jgi:hypothetical protein
MQDAGGAAYSGRVVQTQPMQQQALSGCCTHKQCKPVLFNAGYAAHNTAVQPRSAQFQVLAKARALFTCLYMCVQH